MPKRRPAGPSARASGSATPASEREPTSCSSTRTTCTPASHVRWPSCVGYARVELAPGDEAIVEFDVPSARLAFTDRQFERIVEAGDIDLWVGPSCDERDTSASLTLTGDDHHVTAADERLVGVRVELMEADAVGAGIPAE